MALLKNFSIKWKLSFAIIGTGLILVAIYVVIATRVFERDKISYVFDSQNSRLESMKSEIGSKFERAILSARSVIATFDLSLNRPNAAGEQIFREEKALLGIELWSEDKNQTVFRIEKQTSVLPPAESSSTKTPVGEITLQPLEQGRYLVGIRYKQGENESYRLRAALAMDDLLPTASTTQSIALAQGDRVLAVSDLRGIDQGVFSRIVKDSSGADRTRIWQDRSERFLVSETSLSITGLKLIALTPEAEALGALKTLFNRSVIFLTLSIFGLIFVSLTLARGLTGNLRILTESAQEIGSGNFDAAPAIVSQDEMGILAGAFAKMSQEIKRLLVETREKTRMEQELKTASLIQERLLPAHATTEIGEMEISGMVLTCNECGGDWWYYFARGSDLYVAIADATGHGTPAALITAAARSIFSRLESENLSLVDMMRVWDFAVSSCSQKQVFMTGILARIDTQTGQGVLVNAAHESPYILRHGEDGAYALDYITSDATPRIGEDTTAKYTETSFTLNPNETMILYTDGLFSVELPDGKTLSERRFGKALAAQASSVATAHQMTRLVLAGFNEHRQDLPLPDDVSIVSIRRKGAHQSL